VTQVESYTAIRFVIEEDGRVWMGYVQATVGHIGDLHYCINNCLLIFLLLLVVLSHGY
jgi:hypothetical protein